MGGRLAIFRSEEMECYEVVVPKAVAYKCIAALGEQEAVEFVTEYSQAEKPFVSELELLHTLDKKLRRMVKDLKQMELQAATPDEVPDTPHPNELLNIGSYRMTSLNLFDKLCNEYQEVSERCHKMKEKLTESVEKHRAFLKAHQFMLEVEEVEARTSGPQQTRSSAGVPFASRFTVQVGTLPTAKCNTVETLIWRLTQGNALVRFFPIEPRKYMGKIVGERRSIILVSVQGVKSAAAVTKLCQGFGIVLNHMSWKPAERTFILNRVLERIFELRGVLNEANGHRRVLLEKTAENCKIWFIEIEKMKATYSALNTLEWSALENHAVMTFWVPKSRVDRVFRTLLGVTRAEGVSSPILQKITHYTSSPPTYIQTNKFTAAYQNIINAYGIPSYRELNPMPYTVITFPFIFAIMFGDVGHGIIMTTFASTIICFENRIQRKGLTNEIQSLIFQGRYIILMMGLFSVWTGIVYNDVFSQSVFLYYSHWRTLNYRFGDMMKLVDIQLDPRYDYIGYPYPIGIDPIWKLAENDIIFSNALKMKIAIIVGVSQMTFGIVLNLLNHLHFKNYLAVFTEFVPQIVFFSCIFIYLVFLIFFKWTMYDAQGGPDSMPRCAPSILITFINMMMFSFVPNPDPTCRPEMYPNQENVQKALLITALLCVPVMFFVEPIIEIVRLKRKKQNNIYVDEDEGVMSIMVYQFIHVIEFCLGSVSYTASYLRLWALSLAHYQLSSVLWKMVLVIGEEGEYTFKGVSISMVTFVFFAAFTISILVVIEGLSAFLHALRLHWMEFQSKFYIGLGHSFVPFTFRPILQEAKIPPELYINFKY